MTERDQNPNTIDLEEDNNVQMVPLALTYVRNNMIDYAEMPDALIDALDNAQGLVFTGQAETAYVVIQITKGDADGD